MSVPQTEVLVFVEGQEVARHILAVGAHVFGSAEDCQVCIASPHISRHHARLSVRETGALFVEDLGSTNGTFLDGVKITGLTPVLPNQSIEIGNVTLLVQQQSVSADNGDGTPPELSASTRYEPGPQIAKGGMGAVHAARQPAIRREVAMKVMLRDRNAHDRLRFIEEAQITGQLEHPNIVPVHELAVNERGQPYYTMKLVQGRTLKDILKRLASGDAATVAKYPLAALLTIFQKVCDAVAFAHAKGVIHRDLKPANIMVGDYGEVLLMDWGLAKVIGRDAPPGRPGALGESALPASIHTIRDDQQEPFATLDGAIMGTLQYMSPEQARGEVTILDERSDLFSLGTILYEIVTLCPAFSGNTKQEILAKIQSGEFDFPSARTRSPDAPQLRHVLGGSVPDSLNAVILKALALEREERYQHVAEFQADLTAYQSGFATRAENAGLWKQMRLFLARNKAVSVSVAAGLTFVAVVAAAFTSRLITERNHALASEKRARDALAQVEPERQRANKERDNATAALVQVSSQKKRAEDALGQADSERRRANQERDRTTSALAKVEQEKERADGERDRATNALRELRNTAPTFLSEAENLIEKQQIPAALQKLEFAVAVDPENFTAQVRRAHLLAASLQFKDAVAGYRRALALRTDDSVQANLKVCEKLLAADDGKSSFPDELIDRLYQQVALEKRNVDLEILGERIGKKPNTVDELFSSRFISWHDRAGWGIGTDRIRRDADGKLIIDLSGVMISDLRPLTGLPIKTLYLQGTQAADLSPLKGMAIENLCLDRTEITDLGPLQGMPLRKLEISSTKIRDLTPLRGAPLEWVNIKNSAVTDLAPIDNPHLTILVCGGSQKIRMHDTEPIALATLKIAPLTDLDISYDYRLVDLGPLRGKPLRTVDLFDSPNIQDLRPLLGCPNLEQLRLPGAILKPYKHPWMSSARALYAHPNLKKVTTFDETFRAPSYLLK